MKKIDKKLLVLSTTLLSSVGAANAQSGDGAGSYTSVNGTASVSAGLTVSIMSEKLVFSMDAVRKIDGDYKFFGKQVLISTTAEIGGNGTIYLYDPSDNPTYSQMTADTTRIDGNNGKFITTNKISVLNPLGVKLENLPMPANNGSITYDEGPTTGSKKAALRVGGNLSLDVDGANVFLATNDLELNASGIISNYGVNRMVVTGNSISGHLIKNQSTTSEFIYPVGIAAQDYTPATINANGGTYNVSVIDYSVNPPTSNPDLLGMGRTWHMFGTTPNTNSITLDHNTATNKSKYVDNAAFITQLGQSTNTWSIGPQSDFVSAGKHTNTVLQIPSNSNSLGTYFSKSVVYVPVAGNIWNDGNGDKMKGGTENFVSGNNTSSNGSIPSPSNLFVNLVAADGKILASVPVNADGTYTLPEVIGHSSDLTLMLTTTQGTVGSNATSTLPSGWMATGTNVGTNPTSQAGAASNVINITTKNLEIEDQAFGLNRLPTANSINGSITTDGTTVQTFNFAGSTGNLATLTGSDPEDQATSGTLSSKNVVITSLPNNGTLYYNGAPITTANFDIPNFDPALLVFETTNPGTYTNSSFTYAYKDAAGAISAPATYSIVLSQPLYISLVSFNAQLENNKVLLSWESAQEKDLKEFIVERSANGSVWNAIGTVKPTNTSETVTYSIYDEHPLVGKNLYRLKIVDIENLIEYSNVANVMYSKNELVKVYPNPTSNVVNIIANDKEMTCTIYDATGKRYLQIPLTANDKTTIDLSQLTNGMYLIEIQSKDQQTIHLEKLIKQ